MECLQLWMDKKNQMREIGAGRAFFKLRGRQSKAHKKAGASATGRWLSLALKED
jgi:hypothetical protein